MNEGWQKAPKEYVPTGPYSGLQFPIRKGDIPKPFIVIDECRMADGSYEIKVHKDADEPHNMKSADEWRLWPNKRKLSEWHNEPFRRMTRLASVRATTVPPLNMLHNHWLSLEALRLQESIEKSPDEPVALDRLDWSPSGQVWLDGKRWVKIEPGNGG
jgi:hypothetical protein